MKFIGWWILTVDSPYINCKMTNTAPVVTCNVSLDIVNSFVFSCNLFSSSINNKKSKQ